MYCQVSDSGERDPKGFYRLGKKWPIYDGKAACSQPLSAKLLGSGAKN
jgi:hypothetical protein